MEGTVVEVFADHMIINQQLVLHVNQKVDLKIDANTKLEQASSLIAFKAGDEVEVEYYEVEGAKIAIFIKKVAEVKDSGPEKV